MRKFFIKRASPNTGIVYKLGTFFEEEPVIFESKYVACKEYLREHPDELTIYKVARILNRKNAKRTLYKKFLAENEDEAKLIFNNICKDEEDGPRLQLVTGDWKLIAEKDSNGLIKYI